MSRGRKEILAGVVVLVLAGGVSACLLVHTGEPRWHGKGLRAWTRIYFRGSGSQKALAKEALVQIGTNGVPYVLMGLGYRAPAWHTKLVNQVAKVSVPAGKWLKKTRMFDPQEECRRMSDAFGFCEALGPLAAPALPAYDKAINDKANSGSGRIGIVIALSHMGCPAVPLLLKTANCNRDRRVSEVALSLLQKGSCCMPEHRQAWEQARLSSKLELRAFATERLALAEAMKVRSLGPVSQR